MREKIRVLFLASDPFRDRASLRLDEEVRAVDRALRKVDARGAVELVAHFATRTRDLQDALLRHDPQIVHFAGRGDDPGVLRLGDEQGRPRPVGKEALGRMFGMLSEWIRVVVVNGCDTLPTVEVLGGVVDYAIGMNRPLGDASALVFAEAFYGALAMGRTVPASFKLAVSRLGLEGGAGSAAAVLRVRPGVDPAVPLVAPSPTRSGGGGARPAWDGRTDASETFPGPGGADGPESHPGGAAGRRSTFRTGRPR
jgi:hypothetical protein